MPKKYTIKDRKKLKEKAWLIFSAWIRERDGHTCVTCGRRASDGFRMNAGHFCHNREDFNERNIHCQDFFCNKIKRGNMRVYTLRMVEWYGLDYVKELMLCEKSPPKLESAEFYLDIIKKYS